MSLRYTLFEVVMRDAMKGYINFSDGIVDWQID